MSDQEPDAEPDTGADLVGTVLRLPGQVLRDLPALVPSCLRRGRAELERLVLYPPSLPLPPESRAAQQVARVQSQTRATLRALGLLAPDSGDRGTVADDAPDGPSEGAPSDGAPSSGAPPSVDDTATDAPRPADPAATATASSSGDHRPAAPGRGEADVDADQLAIPEYESLSASQVVPRLAGLADDELEQVRRFEVSKRSRKTILNRIAQLQASGGAPA